MPIACRVLLVGWMALLWPGAAIGWSLVVEQGYIGTSLPDIRTGGWQVTGSQADVRPSINATGDSAVIEFSPTSLVVTDRLAYSRAEQAFLLRDLRTDLSHVTLTLDYGAPGGWPEWVAVEGEVKIDVARIEHPLLVPQAWSFQGRVEGALANLRAHGTLVSESGLEVDLEIKLHSDGAVLVSVSTRIEGQAGVRALMESFVGWPTPLTVNSGSADVSADVRLGPAGALALNGNASLEDVSGVFDRTAFSGVTGGVVASLKDGRITAGFRGLTAEEVNPGIAVSAILLTGDYTAPIANGLDGRLEVRQATARFLEGSLQIPSGTYDLEGGSGPIPVQIQDVSLARLMAVYPAEGLDGSGLLSGRIPISVSRDGLQVREGQVSAEVPGGRLQLPAEKLKAMLGGNQAMDMIVQALQNFHYSLLSSKIDYDETGKLTLDLRLEGESPEIGDDQPIVLNINLEEDIPALLTSLQLSGRVNEAVTKRVRKLLQESGEEAKP